MRSAQFVLLGHAAERIHRGERRTGIFERGDALRRRTPSPPARSSCAARRRAPRGRALRAVGVVRAGRRALRRLAQQAGGIARASFRISPPVGFGVSRVMLAASIGFAVDEHGVAAGMRQQHRIVGRHFVERRVQRKALDVRLRRVVPLRLVPAAARRSTRRAWPAWPRAPPAPRCRPRCAPRADPTPWRNSPIPVKWPWPSMKPGMASCPCRSMTLVLGPIQRCASAFTPSATMRSPRAARNCAVGAAGFMVTILPFVRTRSAGWAKAAAAAAAMAGSREARIGTGYSGTVREAYADLKVGDAIERHPVRAGAGRAVHALDRLPVRLAAQLEGLVMHGEKELAAGVVGHLPGLLGRAVVMDPRVVRSHGHDGQVERARALQAAERRGHGGVAAEKNAVAPDLDGRTISRNDIAGTHQHAGHRFMTNCVLC